MSQRFLQREKILYRRVRRFASTNRK